MLIAFPDLCIPNDYFLNRPLKMFLEEQQHSRRYFQLDSAGQIWRKLHFRMN